MKIQEIDFIKRCCILVGLGMTWMGCSGPRAFTRGEYDDPTRVELLNDQFNESDMQQMAEAVIRALSTCPTVSQAKAPPTVVIETVVNKTAEHIDTVAITEQIKTALIKSEKLRFINKEARELLDQEYEYHQAAKGKVAQQTAKKSGKQIGADYILNGRLMSNIQEVGQDKFVFYQLNIDLTHLEESTIVCSENYKIRKKFEKRRISL